MALSTQLPAFQARVLSGADNVELWTKQRIWDDVLKGIDIVISTHQVLLDALVHGFVPMHQLALLVFDEAHSCTGNHPSSRILRDFYHKSPAEARPSILGLSASPVVSSKVWNLELLESNLNAISRTPKIHRDEMLLFVHQPELIKLVYLPNDPELMSSQALESLRQVYEGLDIEQDPWVIKMKSDPSTCKAKALEKSLISNRTYCHDQIKGLYEKALAVHHELGSFAAEYYVRQCVVRTRRAAAEGSFIIGGLEDPEKVYLRRKIAEIVVFERESSVLESHHTTPKVRTLIQCLREMDARTFSGLIFVRTRVEVAVLSHILSIEVPEYKIATFVGESGFSGRRNTIGDLADPKNQKGTLDDLRLGRRNLIVATNALEEGIDVSACNVVICFDRPPNLKSFIQRRGRARKAASKFVIMFEDDGLQSSAMMTWHELEEEMRRRCMDESRLHENIQRLESVEETADREFLVQSTGARLTLDDAVRHLYHFCATLPAAPYIDPNPIFTFEEHFSGGDATSISAKVLLPNSVDVSVRSACSTSLWITEKMARKDAAFEAYKALHYAGLVNDNLLPLGHVDEAVDEAYGAVEKRPSIVKVSDQIDVWPSIAQCWESSGQIYGSLVRVSGQGQLRTDMIMLLPVEIPAIAGTIDLYWDRNTTFQLVVEPESTMFSPAVTVSAAQITFLLLESVFRARVDYGRYDFTALFMPSNGMDHLTWLSSYSGAIKAGDLCDQDVGRDVGLVRDLSNNGTLHIFQNVRYESSEDTTPDGTSKALQYQNIEPCLVEEGQCQPFQGVPDCTMQLDRTAHDHSVLMEVKRLPKRADFLHPVPSGNASSDKVSAPQWLLANKCEVSRLPFSYSRFALFVPSILHKVQVAVVVERLCNTVLSPLQFQDRSLVATAISASSAHEATDYQRLETLGDSILKIMTSLTLMTEHLNYHEGILSHQKDHIVSNSSLANAAMRMGLDHFIITKSFTGQRWRPLYNGGLAANQPERTREMSTKTLADVVEALIGASYLDGGLQKAVACLEIFLPEVPWPIALRASQILYGVYDLQVPVSTHVVEAEKVISHEFNLKTLVVEALTHPSHYGPNTSSSYQRLEFCGDAILDNIVTTTAFAHNPPLPTHKLHLIRAALVNANLLGFFCLNLSISISRFEALGNEVQKISTIDASRPFYLWQSMRHASPSIRLAQRDCLARHDIVHTAISSSLAHDNHYPWTALARLEPPKFFSDIVESILGAIYIDTHGSLSDCEGFLEHLGLMPYLRRILDNDIAVLHPKEELGHLADREKVRYVLGKEGEDCDERLTCTVFVGERPIVKVGDGLSAKEVQTRAADETCIILRRERSASGSEGSGRVVRAVRIHGEREDDERLSEHEAHVGEGQATGGDYDDDEFMTADEC